MTTERTPAEHRACDSPTLICPHALTRCGGFVQERHVKHCRVCQNPWPCDASLYATQLAEAQAQVAAIRELSVKSGYCLFCSKRGAHHLACPVLNLQAAATRYTEQAEQRGAAKAAMSARLVRVSVELFDLPIFGMRNERGDHITAEWGEPDRFGVYEPTLTQHTDDNLVEKALSVERIAAALRHAEGNYLIFDSPTAVADLAAALREALLSDSEGAKR